MNTLFALAREKFATKQLHWLDDNFRILAVKIGVVIDPEMAQYLSDIPLSARLATSEPVFGKTAAGGYLRAQPTPFPVLQTPDSVGTLIVFHDTGLSTTSTLVVLVDEARSMPFQFNGKLLYVVWQYGNKGVFRL